MADIFISYAREDLERAKQLAEALEAQGWSVFWDRTIPAGRTWRSYIGKALEEAPCVIVAWSTTSIDSDWVQEEADDARQRGVLVPVLFEAVMPPIGFRAIQAADLVGWDGNAAADSFLRLRDAATKLLGRPPAVVKEEKSEGAAVEATRKAEEEQRRWQALAEAKEKVEEELEWRRAELAKAAEGKRKAEKEDRRRRAAAWLARQRTALWIGGIAGVIVVVLLLVPRPWETTLEHPVRPYSTNMEPLATFRDCPFCPEMVVIPGGRFTMGSPDGEPGRYPEEGPRHEVTISRAFALGKYEVTRAEYLRFAQESRVEWPDAGFSQTDLDPAVQVSWEDAQQYVRWLSEKTGEQYRLPSESEWEYAARAGSTTVRYWGDSHNTACHYANVNDGSHECQDGYSEKTAPVGSYMRNAFGLYDMLGNVWELVEDCWNPDYEGAPTDGSAWMTGDCNRHALRGGSWDSVPPYVRSAFRMIGSPSYRSDFIGFRIARTLP